MNSLFNWLMAGFLLLTIRWNANSVALMRQSGGRELYRQDATFTSAPESHKAILTSREVLSREPGLYGLNS
jgi:hypothetical protein